MHWLQTLFIITSMAIPLNYVSQDFLSFPGADVSHVRSSGPGEKCNVSLCNTWNWDVFQIRRSMIFFFFPNFQIYISLPVLQYLHPPIHPFICLYISHINSKGRLRKNLTESCVNTPNWLFHTLKTLVAVCLHFSGSWVITSPCGFLLMKRFPQCWTSLVSATWERGCPFF